MAFSIHKGRVYGCFIPLSGVSILSPSTTGLLINPWLPSFLVSSYRRNAKETAFYTWLRHASSKHLSKRRANLLRSSISPLCHEVYAYATLNITSLTWAFPLYSFSFKVVLFLILIWRDGGVCVHYCCSLWRNGCLTCAGLGWVRVSLVGSWGFRIEGGLLEWLLVSKVALLLVVMR